MTNDPDGLIDWKAFGETRSLLGAGFVRILGYFLEDGTKSVAEEIEVAARHYVEIQIDPSELVEKVVRLRPLFEATVLALEAETSPLVERRPVAAAQRNALGGMRLG